MSDSETTVTPDDRPPAGTVVSAVMVGWRRYLFPSIWLVYLSQAVQGVTKHSDGAAAVAGYLLVAAFAVCYVLAMTAGWTGRHRQFWVLYALGYALTVALAFFAHQDALVCCIYLAVLTVAANRRWVYAAIGGLTVLTGVLPVVIPGWGDKVDWGGALAVGLVALAMFGFFHITRANSELAEARAEVARLAAEGERSRIARDLHDLLGHSLTTITVKAGLARRLAEHGDSERALAEIAEVETLSRRTLGDVRAAVANHREVTLAGEVATAREVLRAAAITAELPGSVDVVDPQLSEVFGWVLREGVTNLVRHSRAQSCKVLLGPRFIEITDTGTGSSGPPGSGLAGLRERLEAVGGTISAVGGIHGFRLRAEVPLPIDVREPTAAVAPPAGTRVAAAGTPVAARATPQIRQARA